MYYCYILYSTNLLFLNRTYIGMSNNPIKRLHQHNNTKHGAKSTKIIKPLEFICIIGNFEDKIEALKKQYSLGLLNESMTLRKREVKDICELLKKLPKTYTYEEIEAAEKTYWEKRLKRQCAEEMAGNAIGINPGNLRSMILADNELGNKFLEFQNMVIENFEKSKIMQIE